MSAAVKVYYGYGAKCWKIGPLGAYEVGDRVYVPERPPRFGLPRPGGEAKVLRVDPDGMATAVPVEMDELEYRQQVVPQIAQGARGVPGRSPRNLRAMAVQEWLHSR